MSHNYKILVGQVEIGVLPGAALLQGAGDFNDILNSWATYTSRAIQAHPEHPVSVLYKANPKLIDVAVTLADTFRLDVLAKTAVAPSTKEELVHKGVRYYVQRVSQGLGTDEVTFVTQLADAVDQKERIREQAAANASFKGNLDLLFTFVVTHVMNSLNNAAFLKTIQKGSVGVAAPALPVQNPPVYTPQATPLPAVVRTANINLTGDAAVAHNALGAFLAK